jgi:hypothetical protein
LPSENIPNKQCPERTIAVIADYFMFSVTSNSQIGVLQLDFGSLQFATSRELDLENTSVRKLKNGVGFIRWKRLAKPQGYGE